MCYLKWKEAPLSLMKQQIMNKSPRRPSKYRNVKDFCHFMHQLYHTLKINTCRYWWSLTWTTFTKYNISVKKITWESTVPNQKVASFMKVVGGNLIQIFLASMNKERKSLKYRYHEHRNSEKGGGLIFLFFQIHSCFFFLFHFLCAH